MKSATDIRRPARVARLHHCEGLLIGLGALGEEATATNLERIMNEVQSDVVVLRCPESWRLPEVRRVVVPVGGRRDQSRLRARLLGSIGRGSDQRIKYIRILPTDTSPEVASRAERDLKHLAGDEVPGPVEVELLRSDRVLDQLVEQAEDCDLLVLGLQRRSRRQRTLGKMTLELAARTTCPIVLISGR